MGELGCLKRIVNVCKYFSVGVMGELICLENCMKIFQILQETVSQG